MNSLGATFAAHGGGTQLPMDSRAALSVMKPAGKEVFNVEKKCDLEHSWLGTHC